jgi:hypothetical protein
MMGSAGTGCSSRTGGPRARSSLASTGPQRHARVEGALADEAAAAGRIGGGGRAEESGAGHSPGVTAATSPFSPRTMWARQPQTPLRRWCGRTSARRVMSRCGRRAALHRTRAG